MVCTGGVRRVHSKCWPETAERSEPIVVYRCGGNLSTKDILRKLMSADDLGSGSGWGRKSNKTADRVEGHVSRHILGVGLEKTELTCLGQTRKDRILVIVPGYLATTSYKDNKYASI